MPSFHANAHALAEERSDDSQQRVVGRHHFLLLLLDARGSIKDVTGFVFSV